MHFSVDARIVRSAFRVLRQAKPTWAEVSLHHDLLELRFGDASTEVSLGLPASSSTEAGPVPVDPSALAPLKLVSGDLGLGAARKKSAPDGRPATGDDPASWAKERLPVVVSGQASADALRRAANVADGSGERPMLSCICVDTDGSLVASDGYRLSVEQTDMRPSVPVLVPAKAVRLALAGSNRAKQLSVSVHAEGLPIAQALELYYGGAVGDGTAQGWAELYAGGATEAARGWAEIGVGRALVRTQLTPLPCFPYRELLKGFPGAVVRLSVGEAMAFARRLQGAPMVMRANGTVRLSLRGDNERAAVVQGLSENGQDVEISFASDFFAEALEHAGGAWARIVLDPRSSYAKRPAKFLGDGRCLVLMPLMPLAGAKNDGRELGRA